MGRREAFLLRGVPIGLVALGLAVVVARTGTAVVPGPAVGASFVLLLALLGVFLVRSLLTAGAWALMDLAVPGVLFAAAGVTLLDTPHRVVAAACIAVGVGGVTALLVGLVAARAEDRDARGREARLEAEREMGRVHRRLWLGTEEVTDGQIRDAVAELEDRVDGDAGSRAAALLGAVAPLCHARPHLADELLATPLRQLKAAGVEDARDALRWVAREVATGSRLRTDDRGRRWLTDELPGMEARIERLLSGSAHHSGSGSGTLAS